MTLCIGACPVSARCNVKSDPYCKVWALVNNNHLGYWFLHCNKCTTPMLRGEEVCQGMEGVLTVLSLRFFSLDLKLLLKIRPIWNF